MHAASLGRGLKLHPDEIVSAFGVRTPPAVPDGDDMKSASEIERPRIKHSNERDRENHAQREHDSNLPETAEATGARPARCGLVEASLRLHTS